MRRSQFFMPILKENPREAEIISHRLMLRAGMIRQESQGIFSWLPLGKRVLEKVCQIIRQEQDRAGALEILMPTIQSSGLWSKSGRYEAYGKEMLRIKDRHDREMLYGPTNEEMVTDIFSSYIKSYKDLPLLLYQIQWKFRDEIRPRFGVMRSREFLMKDCYSFDTDEVAGKFSYNKMFVSYLRIFSRLGLRAIPIKADNGAIGGDLSYEFVVLAPTGESDVFFEKDFYSFAYPTESVDFTQPHEIEEIVAEWTKYYAATSDVFRSDCWEKIPEEKRVSARGIEVGHVFYFGEKYSQPMAAKITGSDGKDRFASMGSYGIGVSRLIAAIIEASHDERGIIWPKCLSPFDYVLINMNIEDADCKRICEDLLASLQKAGKEVLYDDLKQSAGNKFATADLIGVSEHIIINPQRVAEGMIELKNRRTGESTFLSFDAFKRSSGII